MKTLAGPCSVRPGDPVLVCVSGGIDSMVLLECMREAALPMRLRIGVIHVDHGIRGEASGDDAQFVLNRCRDLSLDFFLERLHMDPGLPNLEEEARSRRYAAIIDCMNQEGFRFAATGHTLNDQAETILYRIARGTGIRGLAGIPYARPDGIIRPMLQFTRAQLEAFARERSIGSVMDRTNNDLKHSRNLIRHSLIPVMERINPRAIEAVARLADIARDEGKFVEDMAARLEEGALAFDWGMVRGYAVHALREAEETIVRRFVINAVIAMGGEPRGIDRIQVDAVLDILKGRAAAHTIKRKVKVFVDGPWVVFRQASRGPYYQVVPDAPGMVPVREINADIRIPASLYTGSGCMVRSFLPGDRCGGKKVAEILSRMGITSALRPFWPVLVSGGVVIAVAACGKDYSPGEMTEPA